MDAKSIKNPSKIDPEKRCEKGANSGRPWTTRLAPGGVQLFKNAPQVTYKSTKTTEGNLQKAIYLEEKQMGGNILEVKYQKVTYRGYFTEVNYKKETYRGYFTEEKCWKVTYKKGTNWPAQPALGAFGPGADRGCLR